MSRWMDKRVYQLEMKSGAAILLYRESKFIDFVQKMKNKQTYLHCYGCPTF